MPMMKASFPHELGQQEAKARLEKFFEELRAEHKDKIKKQAAEWDDNRLKYSFSTAWFSTHGTLVVEDKEVLLEGDLPFAGLIFKDRIEAGLREHFSKVLAAPAA